MKDVQAAKKRSNIRTPAKGCLVSCAKALNTMQEIAHVRSGKNFRDWFS